MDVAVYCRVSSDEQAERGTIDNQRVYADKYVKLRDLSVYDYYIDDGVSGMLPLAERPATGALRWYCFIKSTASVAPQKTSSMPSTL